MDILSVIVVVFKMVSIITASENKYAVFSNLVEIFSDGATEEKYAEAMGSEFCRSWPFWSSSTANVCSEFSAIMVFEFQNVTFICRFVISGYISNGSVLRLNMHMINTSYY